MSSEIGVVDVRHSLAGVFVSRRREVAYLRQPIVGIVGVFDLLAHGVRLRRQQAVVICVADGSVLRVRGALQEGQNGGSDVVAESPGTADQMVGHVMLVTRAGPSAAA